MPIVEQRQPLYFDQERFLSPPEINREQPPRVRSVAETAEITALRAEVNIYDRDSLPMIDKAICRALNVHFDENRLTGEPFSMHLLTPARWAAEMGLKKEIIIALLLHDAPENSKNKPNPYGLKEIERDFSKHIRTIVEGVSNFSVRKSTNAAFDLLEAIRSCPEAIVVRALEQEHNSQTIGVFGAEMKDMIWRRNVGFMAPLIQAFGMEASARRMIYNATEAKFPERSRAIVEFIAQSHKYDETVISGFREKMREVLKLEPNSEFEVKLPNLNDLVQITNGKTAIVGDDMLLHVDIGYDGDWARAAMYYARLFENLGQVYIRDNNSSTYRLKEASEDPIKLLLLYGKLDFYQYDKEDGRWAHIRLLPQKDFAFERTSLLPLPRFQTQAAGVSEASYRAAEAKFEQIRNAWNRWSGSKQPKNFTIREFIRYLQGEGSVVVRTDIANYPVLEMPSGSTTYDLICRLFTGPQRDELLQKVASVMILKGNRKVLISPKQAIPTEIKIDNFISADGLQIEADVFDSLATEDGLHDMQRLARNTLIPEYPVFAEAVRQYSWNKILALYRNHYLQKGEVPVEIPIAKLSRTIETLYYDAHDDRKHSVEYSMELTNTFLEEITMRILPPDTIDKVVAAMIEYKNSLTPFEVIAEDRIGLDMDVGAVFATTGINIATKTNLFTPDGKARIVIYVEPKDLDAPKREAIAAALEGFR